MRLIIDENHYLDGNVTFSMNKEKTAIAFYYDEFCNTTLTINGKAIFPMSGQDVTTMPFDSVNAGDILKLEIPSGELVGRVTSIGVQNIRCETRFVAHMAITEWHGAYNALRCGYAGGGMDFHVVTENYDYLKVVSSTSRRRMTWYEYLATRALAHAAFNGIWQDYDDICSRDRAADIWKSAAKTVLDFHERWSYNDEH